ncbi:MAG: phosphoribosylanthranilate isomerase [SAR92 clade bacterium]|uniref:N-(5'-phosphoribosyl)anthranilate isomerase n=1 Tax=SAR92 clade bacterium TaxID=2315479 RepID=A0A520MGE7_9GAMM|nr:MAG: phosphoribosylanthranilate isomerase [SAR92 clade bacterium]
MTVKVKICGVTTVSQVEMIQHSGADAIGLVLYEKSSRYVDLDNAIKLRRAISPDVLCVALVVNADEEFIESVISKLKPDFIQFHGDETAEFCNQFNYPFIRAIRMSESLNILDEVIGYKAEGGFLFDAWNKDHYGGTGETFDWSRLPSEHNFNLILAGGLNPDNVAAAVKLVKPYMVDVSGGVECSAGVKDQGKVAEFIRNAKHG